VPEHAHIDLGRRIRAARVLAALSRAELAVRLGLSEDHIAKWEAGERHPSEERLGQVSAVCEVPVEFFLVDWQVLATPAGALSAQVSSVEDRLARIEAELHIRSLHR
jgi:transcriptional regulator with XRE-family HTH domain